MVGRGSFRFDYAATYTREDYPALFRDAGTRSAHGPAMSCWHFSLTDNPGVTHFELPSNPDVLARLIANANAPRSDCG